MALPRLREPTLRNPREWQALRPVTAYDRLDRLLDRAARDKVLDDLPRDQVESDSDNYEPRARVIGERLWLLGYLGGDKDAARTLYSRDRAAFLAAVARFQREAGMQEDGWVGRRTWTVLSNLVNFEPVTLPGFDWRAWYRTCAADGAWSTAVLRAATLRLQVLGLGHHAPGAQAAPAEAAVRRFHQILWALRLTDRVHGGELDATTLPLLLEHDLLLQRIAAARGPDDPNLFRLAFKARWNPVRFRTQASRLLVSLAQIEFWLLGIEDVDLAERPNYPVAGIEATNNADQVFALFDESDPWEADEPQRRFRRQLREYLRAFAYPDGDVPPGLEDTLSPALFATFMATARDGPAPEPAEAYAAVTGKVEREYGIAKALEAGRTLGMRLWDGLKRLWRWFRRGVRNAILGAGNLIRAFFRYASKGFQVLRRTVCALVHSTGRFLGGGHSYAGVKIAARPDMDSLLYTHAGQPGAARRAAGRRMRLFGARFRFACNILGLFLRVLVAAPGSLLGFVLLARTLAANLKDLLPLYHRMRSLEYDLEYLDEQLGRQAQNSCALAG